jgi:hypothetical protein
VEARVNTGINIGGYYNFHPHKFASPHKINISGIYTAHSITLFWVHAFLTTDPAGNQFNHYIINPMQLL